MTKYKHLRDAANVATKYGTSVAMRPEDLLDMLDLLQRQTVHEQVSEFHAAMDMPGVLPVGPPAVPADDRVRLRVSLVMEEAFEFLEACFDDATTRNLIGAKREWAQAYIATAKPKVDLVEAADALADIDYVVEGSRLEFGINGAPIAAEVHRSNMAKVGGPVREDGKRLKPPGWTPPDVAGELKKQGWVP